MRSARSNTVEFSFSSQGGHGKGHGNGHGGKGHGSDHGGWGDHAATGEVGPFEQIFQASDNGDDLGWTDPSDGWWF